ncbi:MAG: energy transducer TonB, partial [Candidatus Didemnitutus sp.]|nr:energy transducer TonB [Candidatus Didemnitutus sp.]
RVPLLTALSLALLGFPAAVADESPAPPPAATEPAIVTEVDEPAVPLRPIRPLYPQEMLREGVAGEVVLRFIVDAEGLARDVQAVRSNHPAFTRAAVRAVLAARFRPAQLKGEPVATQVSQVVRFILE